MINALNEQSLMSLLSLANRKNAVDSALDIIETINELQYECLGDALDILNRNGNLTNQSRQHLKTIQKKSKVESAHHVKLV